MTHVRCTAAALLAVLIAGCETTSPPPPTPSSKPQASQVEPGPQGSRKINRNLSGYSTDIPLWTDDYSNLFQILK